MYVNFTLGFLKKAKQALRIRQKQQKQIVKTSFEEEGSLNLKRVIPLKGANLIRWKVMLKSCQHKVVQSIFCKIYIKNH